MGWEEGGEADTEVVMGDEGRSGWLKRLDEAAGAGGQVTLARLILELGIGVERLDEAFARGVARTLDEAAGRLGLPVIDAMGLEDVVVTLYLDETARLVVTGQHAESGGAVSVRWDEEQFPFVFVELLENQREDPYVFATLDFSVRGRRATLRRGAPPWPAGQEVRVRALATIGDKVEVRVSALGVERSVPPEWLDMQKSP